ncbi:MAG: phosphoribosyltransferase [Nitrospirota bacterium]|jgi:putative phosphoribosyl transferase
MVFKNRRDAGRQVAERLRHYKDREDVLVLGLPRGGAVNAEEIARALHCPMDILIIRKLGFPGQPELAMGAVAETGAVVRNESVIRQGAVTEERFQSEVERQKEEIERRKERYRGGQSIPDVSGKTVILVDDGVATGSTMKAAIQALREAGPARLVVAVPVSSREAEAEIRPMVDEWLCLETPQWFMAIGGFYDDFAQVSDEEVVEILNRRRRE